MQHVTLKVVDKRTVIVEGKLGGVVDWDEFTATLVDALDDLGAEDPYVITDAEVSSFHVGVVVEARAQALTDGMRIVIDALSVAGAPVQTAEAHTEELAAA
jgi:hypothetical protein